MGKICRSFVFQHRREDLKLSLGDPLLPTKSARSSVGMQSWVKGIELGLEGLPFRKKGVLLIGFVLNLKRNLWIRHPTRRSPSGPYGFQIQLRPRPNRIWKTNEQGLFSVHGPKTIQPSRRNTRLNAVHLTGCSSKAYIPNLPTQLSSSAGDGPEFWHLHPTLGGRDSVGFTGPNGRCVCRHQTTAHSRKDQNIPAELFLAGHRFSAGQKPNGSIKIARFRRSRAVVHLNRSLGTQLMDKIGGVRVQRSTKNNQFWLLFSHLYAFSRAAFG